MTTYQYWVARYVPSAVREEFVNIAVIAGHDQDWAFRRVSALNRAARLGGSAAEATQHFLTRIESQLENELVSLGASLIPSDDAPTAFAQTLEAMRRRRNGVVQLSAPRPVIAGSADEAAERVFEIMVVDEGQAVRHRDRTMIARSLRKAFMEEPRLVSVLVKDSSQAVVDGQDMVHDVALASNKTLLLSQAWSFDVADVRRVQTNIQAWNYVVNQLREEGGSLVGPRRKGAEVRRRPIPKNVSVSAVYRPPKTSDGEEALELALHGWKKLGVDAFEAQKTKTVVRGALELVA